MTSTELITPRRAPHPPEPASDARRDARPAASAQPTVGEAVRETLPLVEAIPFFGPPAIFLVGPWALFALLLVGPFAVLFTLAFVMVAAAAAVALIVAALAAPFLLVRHVARHARWHRTGHEPVRAPARTVARPVVAVQPH